MDHRWTLLLALAACAPSDDAGKDDPDTDATDTDVGDTDAADTDDAPVDTDTDTDDAPGGDDTAPPAPPTLEDCFGDLWDGAPPVDYGGLFPVMGSHCYGTNHQDITDVERVVFIGDSITLGTLPTLTRDWWRNRVADELAQRFGLTAPNASWRNVDPFGGEALQRFSGDFAVCAKYGARTDDLIDPPHEQMQTCMPEDERDKKTLVLITMGGNDIFSLLEDVNAGVDTQEILDTYAAAAQLMRDAIAWVKEPGRFPNGVYVVFANTYDFSDPDGAEDMAACEGAQLIGMSPALRTPTFQQAIAEAQREYLEIALDHGVDLVFLGETFCGHGYNTDDASSRCYRGPGAATWLDFTCEHPNRGGHSALTRAFVATVTE